MLSPKISLIPVIFGTMLTVQRKLSCDALIIPDFKIFKIVNWGQINMPYNNSSLNLALPARNNRRHLHWLSVVFGYCSFTLASPASSSRAAREMLMSCLHWELSLWVTRWMLRTSRPAAVSGRARPYNTPKYQTPQRIEQSRIQATQLRYTGQQTKCPGCSVSKIRLCTESMH